MKVIKELVVCLYIFLAFVLWLMCIPVTALMTERSGEDYIGKFTDFLDNTEEKLCNLLGVPFNG